MRATDAANNLGQAISTTFSVKRPATATGPKLTRIKLTATATAAAKKLSTSTTIKVRRRP